MTQHPDPPALSPDEKKYLAALFDQVHAEIMTIKAVLADIGELTRAVELIH